MIDLMFLSDPVARRPRTVRLGVFPALPAIRDDQVVAGPFRIRADGRGDTRHGRPNLNKPPENSQLFHQEVIEAKAPALTGMPAPPGGGPWGAQCSARISAALRSPRQDH
jgi:hypothetical protein